MQPVTRTRNDLAELRRRRAELRETMGGLERAAFAPSRNRAADWGNALNQALQQLADDFVEHIEVTEGPDGLHQEILAGDLRLANAVDALTADHGRLSAEIASLLVDSDPPVLASDVADLRERATALLGHLVRHRERGAVLIYEAYQTDLGGGD